MSIKSTISSLSYQGWQNFGPQYQYFANIQSNDIANNDYFGSSIDCNNNGNFLIIGANGANLGAAYFFYRNTDTSFIQANKVTPNISDYAGSPYPLPQFGTKVAISGDGNYVAVGSPYSGIPSAFGAVYFYERIGNNLNYMQTIYSSNISPISSDREGFGRSVDLNYFGNTVIIGCNDSRGEVIICTRAGNTWSYAYTLYPSPNVAGTYYGGNVAISSNSNVGIATAYQDDDGGTNAGAIYIYNITTGSLSTKILGTTAVPINQTIDIDSTGNFIAFSANNFTYVLKSSANSWANIFTNNLSLLGNITSISLTSNAIYSAAGQGYINASPANIGNVYIYSNANTASNITLFQNLKPPTNTANQYFGSQVKISNDSNYAFITLGTDLSNTSINKVYAYIKTP